MKQVKLGDKVKDKVTGFKGIVVSISKHLYGCDRVGVQPEIGKDGKVPDAGWFDIDSIELVKSAVVKGHTEEPAETKRGGPTLPGQIPTRSNPR